MVDQVSYPPSISSYSQNDISGSAVVEINKTNLSNLLQEGESTSVEFKTSFNDEAIEAVGAFANAHGGMVLIGINDSGNVVGFSVGKKTLEDIANRIQEATDPRIQPLIVVVEYEEKQIVVIQVSAMTGTPVSVRGRYFRRSGKTVQRMSHEEIMQRIITSTGISWDSVIETGASLDDLDPLSIKQFVNAIKKNGRLPIPSQASDEEILRKLELLKNNSPTRAAVLLFGKNPESFYSSAFVKIGRFRSPTHIVDDRELHDSIINQINNIMSWFKERLATEFIITGNPEREVKWEYPLEAIREAVTNAICHRDYKSLAHIQIRLYDDRLEIWNPGGLPSSLTPELLLTEHDSMPRNRKIAETFFYMGLIERWGSGTLRMAEELKTSELPPPQFISESGRFRVLFCKKLLAEEKLESLELSSRHRQSIAYVQDNGSISNMEYQKITGVSKRTATRDLNELVEKGVFFSEGKTGKGTVYKLKGPKGS